MHKAISNLLPPGEKVRMTLSRAQNHCTSEGAQAPTAVTRTIAAALCKQSMVTDDVGAQQPEVTWIAAAVAGGAIRNRKKKEKRLLFSFCLITSDKCLSLEVYLLKPTDKGVWKMYFVGFKPVLRQSSAQSAWNEARTEAKQLTN